MTREFPDPDRFDIDRERKGGFNLGFGYGVHSCLGAALARMEGRIALDMMLDLIPEYDVDRSALKRVSMSMCAGGQAFPCVPGGGERMPGRTIVITGASDGIGAAAARRLCDQGETVVLVGRSSTKTAAIADEFGRRFVRGRLRRLVCRTRLGQ